VSRQAQRDTLVLSAAQTLASALRTIAIAQPKWIVIVPEEAWQIAPYLYAYRARELMNRTWSAADQALPLGVALDLRDRDASTVHSYDSAQRATPDSTASSVTARRVITVDADNRPSAVSEPDQPTARSAGGTTPAAPRLSPVDETASAGADTAEVRLAAHAPSVLSVGSDDIIDIIVALASDATVIPGSIVATASTTEPITALLTIFGDAIVATGPKVVKLNSPKAGTPSQNVFEIRAIALGTVQAAIIFRQGSTELGNIRHTIRAVVRQVRTDRTAGEVAGAARVQDDNGVLLLRAGNEIRYRYRVQCTRLDLEYAEFESPRLLDENGSAAASELAFVRRIYANMTEQVLRTPDQARRFALEVSAFAENLCAQLFPPELVQRLWAGREQVDAIRVMSWEPFIPWELIKLAIPAANKADDRYLGEYGMVRWLAGRSPARTLPLASWSYLAASYPNNPANNVLREVEYFTTVLPQHGIQPVQVPSTYDGFIEAIQNPTFDVMHIACHGDVKEDDIDKAEVLISDEMVSGRPQYVSVSANVFGKVARFGDRRPLVFLNACEAGRLGASLTAWGGWPSRLINAGAGAVVGASWPIRDVASNKFATAFYDALIGGKSLAEASTDARHAAATGDATWMAFKCLEIHMRAGPAAVTAPHKLIKAKALHPSLRHLKRTMTMERRPVQSREYKVMLKPRGFSGDEEALVRGASAFWNDFCAKAGDVVIEAEGELRKIKTRRLVTFFDTSKQHLKGGGYIFRSRRDIDSDEREVTLKFRHPDRFVAQDRSMDAAGPQDGKTKFEEDIKAADKKAPFVSLYSFSTTLPILTDSPSRDLEDLARLFPDVAERLEGFRESEALTAVSGFTAREVVVEGGSIKIGKHPKVEAECALIVWYDHSGRKNSPVTVEFSYRYGDKEERYGGTTARRAFDTFHVLQTELTEWVEPKASTKTAFVYR
jgi:hypothetical protein